MSITQTLVRISSIYLFICLAFSSYSQNSLDWAISNSDFLNNNFTTDLDVHAGAVYSVGTLHGTIDLDPGAGVFNVTSNGGTDFYIQKLDATTGAFIWGKSFGGSSSDSGKAIEVDASGNVYVTGIFNNTVDFDPGPGVFNLTTTGSGGNIYVLKLNSFGFFVWAKSLPGFNFGSTSYDIAIDGSSNAYITGDFNGSVDFDPGVGTDIRTAVGSQDVYVLKLNSSGNFVWARTFGGSEYESGRGIHVDALGNTYTTGSFSGTVDLDPGVGILNFTAPTGAAFIQKLDPSGNLVWAKHIVGVAGTKITVDASGSVYIIGGFTTTVDFDPDAGTFFITPTGGDTYILKLTSSGALDWVKTTGATSGVLTSSIQIDSNEDVFVSGWFYGSVDFDPSANSEIKTSNGNHDVYIQKFTPAGNLIWAESFGGTARDYCAEVIPDNNGGVFIGGHFDQTVDFDPSAGVFNLTSAASEDAFVLKLTECPTSSSTDVQTACDSYLWIDGNTYTSSNNTATHILTNAAGCDSTVTLDLTINNSTTGTDTQTACGSYIWIDGNTYTSSNNSATHVLTNAAGCDSTVTLDLTINYSTTGTDTQTACDSYTWMDGNTYTISNNTATHIIPNAAGCDSTVTLDLTINNSTTGTDTQTA
ncbi:hypothetical protein N9089_05310, partial [Crocinitomicaceae bacterium]|nr:hypothetical protein [Crocinitomicaceae bacterium]